MDWPCWEMDEGIIDLTQNVPLPVKGYTGQSNDNVALANRLKEAEERYLRELDELDTFPNTDKRSALAGLALAFFIRRANRIETHAETCARAYYGELFDKASPEDEARMLREFA